jgi:hypothetical protein
MSNALAIASVTAVLKDLLDNVVGDQSVSKLFSTPPLVSVLPPSRVKVGDEEVPQLNLFLYHVAPNAAWRNVGLPSRSDRGDRMTSPPLALELYFLLTGYGKQYLEAEALLGCAMQMFHDMPVLTREAVQKMLKSNGGGNIPAILMNALSKSGLADQVELVKITPQTMNTDEISRLWDALEAGYRPSVTYQASVLLIERMAPKRSPPPVLTIGRDDSGIKSQIGLIPPYPAILGVRPPEGKISADLGDILVISGHHLGGDKSSLIFRNRHLKDPIVIDIPNGSSPGEIRFQLPADPNPDQPDPDNPGPSASWPAGFYMLSAVFQIGDNRIETNEVAFSLAPKIITHNFDDKTSLMIRATPQVRPDQRVSLLLGDREIPLPPMEKAIYDLFFKADAKLLHAGKYLTRLRVDGVDSRYIDLSSRPPAFIESQRFDIP